TNDVHAEYESWLKCAGLIKRRRAEVGPENCLVVDAGDHFDMGVNECRLSGGRLNLDLLAEIG
ncbi:MAG TPA: bifunctional metallophosphatase/5'-nucleotidase, partial [Firmicutes bacterium]|nr:bifunctional metallophosphatase/5'-nucleotidase [Bacillota bacterium]